ncbi:hypothetical protein B296_00025911 [Ensete ventricosum]|uniref:Uncharacterized protein n=1 Tax=Ensete ventricosum TaxID=4639 RepID=A0A426Z0K3_ENSVE|nr:hypothetical protein B296_00025911 [Ensete ventricosum]
MPLLLLLLQYQDSLITTTTTILGYPISVFLDERCSSVRVNYVVACPVLYSDIILCSSRRKTAAQKGYSGKKEL